MRPQYVSAAFKVIVVFIFLFTAFSLIILVKALSLWRG
jgi:hypothetical protein